MSLVKLRLQFLDPWGASDDILFGARLCTNGIQRSWIRSLGRKKCFQSHADWCVRPEAQDLWLGVQWEFQSHWRVPRVVLAVLRGQDPFFVPFGPCQVSQITNSLFTKMERERLRLLLKTTVVLDSQKESLAPDPIQIQKLSHLVKLQSQGLNFNHHLVQTHAYRNPSILSKLVDYLELNEYGSNDVSMRWKLARSLPEDAYYDQYGNDKQLIVSTRTGHSTLISSHTQGTDARDDAREKETSDLCSSWYAFFLIKNNRPKTPSEINAAVSP